ncbi:hypothetical protein NLJ89_g11518 [Agrocybe chaxingu]|uniref:Uncharacterized protein n=1 Tax=Agrocybe chaxingu TaxID=84603 RepID=A0A9W8MPA8_9AGAR|nr:hypothetical protein NLJ89_g11518 [Agrocybe chaxingu]
MPFVPLPFNRDVGRSTTTPRGSLTLPLHPLHPHRLFRLPSIAHRPAPSPHPSPTPPLNKDEGVRPRLPPPTVATTSTRPPPVPPSSESRHLLDVVYHLDGSVFELNGARGTNHGRLIERRRRR